MFYTDIFYQFLELGVAGDDGITSRHFPGGESLNFHESCVLP